CRCVKSPHLTIWGLATDASTLKKPQKKIPAAAITPRMARRPMTASVVSVFMGRSPGKAGCRHGSATGAKRNGEEPPVLDVGHCAFGQTLEALDGVSGLDRPYIETPFVSVSTIR